jgi:hypothetical protein
MTGMPNPGLIYARHNAYGDACHHGGGTDFSDVP